MYETDSGWVFSTVTADVLQGSILGPVLWNIMYDGVLRLRFPQGVDIVGFADDIVLTVTRGSTEEVGYNASLAIKMVEDWMKRHMLELAHHKTEVVMISNRKSAQSVSVQAGSATIESRRELKYLGVILDDRLSFTTHVDYACKKASGAIAALTRMMANTSGVYADKRRLLASVSTSIVRYGFSAWQPGIKTEHNRAKLSSTHRLMCLRVASAYRTVSGAAICVIATMIPITLFLEVDANCYLARGTRGSRLAERLDTIRR